MAVILTILKIIGILVLTLMGLFLAVTLVILLVPVRYQAQGAYQKDFSGSAKVSWLFGAVRFRASYENGFSYRLRLFGFRFLPRTPKQERPQKKRGRKQDETGPPVFTPPEPAKAEKQESVPPQPEPGTERRESRRPEEPSENRRFPVRAPEAFRKWKSQFSAFCATIKGIRGNFTYYKRVLEREDSRQALRAAWTSAGAILFHVRPRKFRVRILAGTGDPASTGRLLAWQGMLYPWLAGHVEITPDFEEKRLEGDFQIAGHVLVLVLLCRGLQIFFNRELRQLIQLLRKKEET